ncbi:MAG: hypothetical protein AABX02_00125, partial [archaeon]
YTLLKSTTLADVQSPTSADFDNPPGVSIALSGGTNTTAYLDSSVTNGTNYYYALRVCDDVTGLCSVAPSSVGPLIPHLPVISFSLGSKNIVFDWDTDQCEPLDVPDTFATAVFTNGELILSANNAPTVYMRRGTNFSNLNSDCANKSLISSQLTTPHGANNYEWVNAIYKKGTTMYGLVHNEYHDTTSSPLAPCTTSLSPSNPCWWNTITLTKSTNNGRTFDAPASPAPTVSSGPLAWNKDTMVNPVTGVAFPYGQMTPTNIISRNEGGTIYYYSFFFGEHGVGVQNPLTRGICLMRTSNLDDPSSWRAWNGSSFSLTMSMPYSGSTPANTGQPNCSYISLANIATITGHVTFNTYLQEYIMVGLGAKHDTWDNPLVIKCGMWLSHSKDLISWTKHKLIFESTFSNDSPQCNNSLDHLSYGSMLDQDQINDPNDPNFELSDNQFHLYFTIHNSQTNTLDRDLVRRPLTITKT